MGGTNQTLRETQQLNQALTETRQRMSELSNQSLLVQNSVSQSLGQVRRQLHQLGNTMIPVANIGLNLFRKLLSLLQPVAKGLASFMTTLFGVKWAGQAREITKGTTALGRRTSALKKHSSALKKAAKATHAVAKANKAVAKAQRDLLSFDEINKLSERKSSDGSAGTGGKMGKGGSAGGYGGGIGRGGRSVLDGMKVAVSGWALKVRKILADIWSPFQKAWKRKGEYVLKSARTALDKIIRAAKFFGSTWLDVWKGDVGVKIVTTILNIIGKACETVGNLADRFREAWESCGNGQTIAETVFGIFQDGLDCVESLVTATKDWSETLDLAPATSSVGTLLESFRKLADVAEGALSDAYKNVLLPLAGWSIQTAVPTVLGSLASAFDLLGGALGVVKPLAQAVWENFLQPLAQWSGTAATTALSDLNTVLSKLGGVLGDIGNVLSSSDSWTDKLMSIGGLLVAGLKDGISSAFSGIEGWVKSNVVGKIIDAMGGLDGGVKALFNGAFSGAVGVWSNIGSKFDALAGKAVGGLKKGLGGHVRNLFGSAYSAACGAWQNGSRGFKTIAGRAVSGLRSGLGINRLRRAVTTPFHTALNAVIALANRVVSKINGALRFSWNAVRVAGITLVRAGGVVLAHLPHISFLAQGGVLNRATPVVAGEAGAEAVVPLERNLGWLDKMAGMLAGKMGGGTGQPIVVQCVLDGRVIATSTVNYINQRARATGINPLGAYI